MCKHLAEFDVVSRERHDERKFELEAEPTLRLVADAFEEQVNQIITEMERLSCMLAGNGCPEGAMQLDAGPRTSFEKMAPWINYRVVEKLHRRL